MNNTPTVHILMATFNGDKYLKDQLDSLISQSYKSWHLHIRDDHSNDNSVDIINDYITKYDNISLTINPTGPDGAAANFSSLLDKARADKHINYIMFCDQDDVWKPGKI